MGELSYSAEISLVDAFTTQHTSVLRGAWAQCEAVGASGVGGQSGGGVDSIYRVQAGWDLRMKGAGPGPWAETNG